MILKSFCVTIKALIPPHRYCSLCFNNKNYDHFHSPHLLWDYQNLVVWKVGSLPLLVWHKSSWSRFMVNRITSWEEQKQEMILQSLHTSRDLWDLRIHFGIHKFTCLVVRHVKWTELRIAPKMLFKECLDDQVISWSHPWAELGLAVELASFRNLNCKVSREPLGC